MNDNERHRAATAEFSAASVAYESALMSGDEDAVAAADERLDAAERAFNDTLAVLVDEDGRAAPPRPSDHPGLRGSLPSFLEMLAHPWCQPTERTELAAAAVVYGPAVAQTAGLPVVVNSASLAASNPGRYESEAWKAAYRELVAATGDRHAPVA